MYKKARKRKRGQKGGALPFAALLPFAAKALPWIGKAALGGAASFGSSKILGKIFGGGKRKPYIKGKRLYLGRRNKPYVRARKRGRKRKQRGGFFPSPAFYIAKKLVKSFI